MPKKLTDLTKKERQQLNLYRRHKLQDPKADKSAKSSAATKSTGLGMLAGEMATLTAVMKGVKFLPALGIGVGVGGITGGSLYLDKLRRGRIRQKAGLSPASGRKYPKKIVERYAKYKDLEKRAFLGAAKGAIYGAGIGGAVGAATTEHDEKGWVRTLAGAGIGAGTGALMAKAMKHAPKYTFRRAYRPGTSGASGSRYSHGGPRPGGSGGSSGSGRSQADWDDFFRDYSRSQYSTGAGRGYSSARTYVNPLSFASTDAAAFTKLTGQDFGKVTTKVQAKKMYWAGASKHHPDKPGVASDTSFKELGNLWEKLQKSPEFSKLAHVIRQRRLVKEARATAPKEKTKKKGSTLAKRTGVAAGSGAALGGILGGTAAYIDLKKDLAVAQELKETARSIPLLGRLLGKKLDAGSPGVKAGLKRIARANVGKSILLGTMAGAGLVGAKALHDKVASARSTITETLPLDLWWSELARAGY